MNILYAILLNIAFAILFFALYIFILLSGLASAHGHGLEAGIAFCSCIALHLVTFALVWKRVHKTSYITGLVFAIAEWALVILYYTI